MKNFKFLCVGILIIVLITATGCRSSKSHENETIVLLSGQNYGNSMHLEEKREQLHHFITSKLSYTYGISTNFQDTDQAAEVATGHEVLSESAGLMMRFTALTGKKAAFDQEWARAQQIFDLTDSFSYRYSPKLQKKHSLNAAIDDLRIIRALFEAGSVFKENDYTVIAETYGLRLFEKNIKDLFLYDFYDETYKLTNDFITLCYIDLKTIRLLPLHTDNKVKLEKNMLQVLHGGYLTDDFPFYETRYTYKDKAYSSEDIVTVESLLTILALSEVRQHNSISIDFLKERLKAGPLYGKYTREGIPVNDVQSTAIYAISAIIGSELKDEELYRLSINRMNEFQIKDVASPLYGGFGNPISLEAYSFDNLMALLAYTY